MKPKIYPQKEHGIDIEKIDPKVLYILEKLRAADYSAYLVGGSVRDLLLKKNPKDFDISTSAKPEEIKTLFSSAILIGKRFRLAHVRFGRKVFEVSTFRAGNTELEELITEDNRWGSPEEDALRRDFTINGLFYESSEETIIDYVGGYSDIKKKYLRAIGQPYLRFKQDPVRMIRFLKFQARFGLEVDEEARLALIECKADIVKSAPARVLEELLRMLESGAAAAFFKLMADHGVLQHLLPVVAEFLEEIEGNEIYSFLQEVDAILQEPHNPPIKRPILLACIMAPILEKRLKVRFTDKKKLPHLGDIYRETYLLIHAVFAPFFRLPRRLRMSTLEVLVSQHRITPFQRKKKAAIRIPNVPDFSFALQFFNIRCRIEPGLQEIGVKWNQAHQQVLSKKTTSKNNQRRRKKR